jgi:hypothetical protein
VRDIELLLQLVLVKVRSLVGRHVAAGVDLL